MPDPLDDYMPDRPGPDPLDAYRAAQPAPAPTAPPAPTGWLGLAQRIFGSGMSGNYLSPRGDIRRDASEYAGAMSNSALTSLQDIAVHPETIVGPGQISMARLTWTPAMAEAARRFYVTQRMPLMESADRIGVSGETLRQYLQREGIPLRTPWEDMAARFQERTQLPPAEELRALHQQGTSYTDLAARYGVAYDTIMRRLNEIGYRPGAPVHPADLVSRLQQLRQQGRSYTEAARELGISRGAVAGLISRLRASGQPVPAFLLALAGAGSDQEPPP